MYSIFYRKPIIYIEKDFTSIDKILSISRILFSIESKTYLSENLKLKIIKYFLTLKSSFL